MYTRLLLRALALREEHPDTFAVHNDVHFFKRVRRSMNHCLEDPAKTEYRLGKTLDRQSIDGKQLGKGHGHWRRIKNGLPERYRLFFQFSSEDRNVLFVWLNDQRSLRKENDKNDVYAVFARFLSREEIKNTYAPLLEMCHEYRTGRREQRIMAP